MISEMMILNIFTRIRRGTALRNKAAVSGRVGPAIYRWEWQDLEFKSVKRTAEKV